MTFNMFYLKNQKLGRVLAILSLGLAWELAGALTLPDETRLIEGQVVPVYTHTVLPPPELDAPIAHTEKSVRSVPQSALNRVALAGLYLQKSQRTGDLSLVDKAEEQGKKSLELLPTLNSGAKLILARVAEERHQFSEAIRLAEDVLKLQPGHAGAVTSLITSHLGYGNLDEAARTADKAVSSYPYLDAYLLRALVKEAQGLEAEAIADYLEGISREDLGSIESSAYGRTLLARLHLSRGRLEASEALLVESLRILPGYHLALSLLAAVEARRGSNDKAMKLYEVAFNALNEPPYLMDHGNLKESLGDVSGAERLRRQAEEMIRTEMTSGPYGHHNELARVILELGNSEQISEALSETETEVRIRPNAESFHLRAWALSDANRWEEARSAIQKALETGVQDAQYLYRAGLIEQGLGNLPEAVNYFDQALEIDPTFKDAQKAREII